MIYEVEAQFLMPVWRRVLVLADSEEDAVNAVSREEEREPRFWDNAHEDWECIRVTTFQVVGEEEGEEGFDLQA